MAFWVQNWEFIIMMAGGTWFGLSLSKYPEIDFLGMIIGALLFFVGLKIKLSNDN